MKPLKKNTTKDHRYWAIVPAAGIGRRMNSNCPKQYLKINQQFVIDYVMECLISYSAIHGVVVALSENDSYWPASRFYQHEKVMTVMGGKERYESVNNGLNHLISEADMNDWVLVHDAARPCLTHADIDCLINEVNEHDVGGLLGVPMSDTVKFVNPHHVVEKTIDRSQLWRAYTPQMFRFGMLRQALEKAIHSVAEVTDEASAIEQLGKKPLMIKGHAGNIKITHPEDLSLAKFYLNQKQQDI